MNKKVFFKQKKVEKLIFDLIVSRKYRVWGWGYYLGGAFSK